MAGAETKTGPASAGLRFLASAVAFGAPAPALAAAWIAPIDGQQIFTTAAGRREGVTYYETSGYVESPLTATTALVLSPWIVQDSTNAWRGEATIAAKHVVARTEHTITAVQAGALWVSEPPVHCQEGGAELRVLGGASLPYHSFMNVEAAERVLSGGCADQRVDVTAGIHSGSHWLGMAQVFVDGPQYGDETVKLQLSLVHFDDHGHGVQFGVRDRVDGGEHEPALVLALWTEPGRARRRRRLAD